MKEYLIIGGTNDGKRIEFEEGTDTLYIQLPNNLIGLDFELKETKIVDKEFVPEQYKKAPLACYLNPINNTYEEIDRIYALDGMSDFEILDSLINNYKRNK